MNKSNSKHIKDSAIPQPHEASANEDSRTDVNIKLEGPRVPCSFRCNKKLWKAFVSKIRTEKLSTCHVLEPFLLAYVISHVYIRDTSRVLIENFVVERAVKRIRRYAVEEVDEKSVLQKAVGVKKSVRFIDCRSMNDDELVRRYRFAKRRVDVVAIQLLAGELKLRGLYAEVCAAMKKSGESFTARASY